MAFQPVCVGYFHRLNTNELCYDYQKTLPNRLFAAVLANHTYKIIKKII